MALARDDAVDDDLAARRAITSGHDAPNGLCVEVRQARREASSLSFFAVGSLSTLPSFCSTIGVMTMLFAPSSFICSRISCSAPLPMASIAITDATPKRMPSDVSPARSLLWATASAAVPALNARCAMSACSRDAGGAGARPIPRRSVATISPWLRRGRERAWRWPRRRPSRCRTSRAASPPWRCRHRCPAATIGLQAGNDAPS